MRVAAVVVVVAAIAACHSGADATSPSGSADPVARVDRIARICAKIASCAHPHDAARERDPSACVDAWLSTDDDATLLGCVDAARSCPGVDACQSAHAGDRAAASYCRAHRGEQTACDGQRLVTCSDDDPAESTSIDCGAFGATCGEIHGEGGLVAHGCASPTLCPRAPPKPAAIHRRRSSPAVTAPPRRRPARRGSDASRRARATERSRRCATRAITSTAPPSAHRDATRTTS